MTLFTCTICQVGQHVQHYIFHCPFRIWALGALSQHRHDTRATRKTTLRRGLLLRESIIPKRTYYVYIYIHVYDCVCMYDFHELTCVNCVTSHGHGSWPKISWALQPPCNVNVLQPVHGRDSTPARGTWHFSDLTESVRICIYHIHIIDIMPYDEMMSIAFNS